MNDFVPWRRSKGGYEVYVIDHCAAAAAVPGLTGPLAPFHCAEMSDPSPFSDPPGSNLPDKPLVVKCDYHTRRSKLSFRSARNCTYDGLQEKVPPSLTISLILKHHVSDHEAFRP